MTIDHCYCEHNYILIAEKETLKSHLKKQGKAFFTANSMCYESMLKGLSKEATLVLSNTRELDRVPNTK